MTDSRKPGETTVADDDGAGVTRPNSGGDGAGHGGAESGGGKTTDAGPRSNGGPTTDTGEVSDGRTTESEVASDGDPSGGGRRVESPVDDSRVGEGLLDETMGPSSAFAHLYRGEVHRMKLWRERLDRTGNWSVLLMAAVLTWAFSDPSHPHYVLLVGGAGVGIFLGLEARRYRAYDIWRARVRTLQRNVWSTGLHPDRSLADDEWRRRLADDYAEPTHNVSLEEAIAHRLRRVYLPLFALLVAAWVLRVTAFAAPLWPASAATGTVPGVVVTGVVAAVGLVLVVVSFRPRTWHTNDEIRSALSDRRR